MIKLSPELAEGFVGDKKIRLESRLSLEPYKEGKYKVIIEIVGLDFPYIFVPIAYSFFDVTSANPDELREFQLMELPSLVEQYSNQLEKIISELKQSKTDFVYSEVFEVGVNKFLYDSIEKIVAVKDNPEFTKERIIMFLEKVLVVTYDSVNHPTRDEELAHWKNQCEHLRKELAKHVPGGVK